MKDSNKSSVITRSPKSERVILRHKEKSPFREQNEIKAAYEQVGQTPNRNTKSWYRDIYEFYQNNEV